LNVFLFFIIFPNSHLLFFIRQTAARKKSKIKVNFLEVEVWLLECTQWLYVDGYTSFNFLKLLIIKVFLNLNENLGF
tara:strand:- start:813 stop:1043 length:231 start_codon:yes stop_codon:yes gene_type:complete